MLGICNYLCLMYDDIDGWPTLSNVCVSKSSKRLPVSTGKKSAIADTLEIISVAHDT